MVFNWDLKTKADKLDDQEDELKKMQKKIEEAKEKKEKAQQKLTFNCVRPNAIKIDKDFNLKWISAEFLKRLWISLRNTRVFRFESHILKNGNLVIF